MNFNDIIGQDKIKDSLIKAFINNNVAHGYLFEGPKSIGKEKLARVFAKTLLCKEQGSFPCDKCSCCLKFDSGNHPDFYIDEPQGDSFKKEQIEDIQRSMRTLPYEGKRKVYIIKDAHKMTDQAQNSFLKTLEEPPSYINIILTTNNSYILLPTILSRCQILKFTPVEEGKIRDLLVSSYNKNEEEARFIASFSNGIVGKAINLSESHEFKSLREEIISVIDNTLSCDAFKIFSISDFFKEKEGQIEEILDIILIWFRDLLLIKEIGNPKFIINKDKEDLLLKQCINLSSKGINDIIEAVNKAKVNIASKVNYQLALEVMLLKIQEV